MQAKMIRIFPTKTSWCFPATPFFSGWLHQNTAKWMRHTCADKSESRSLLNRPITKPRLAPAGFGQQRPSRLSSLQAGLFWHNLDGSTSSYPPSGYPGTLVQWNHSLPKFTPIPPKKKLRIGCHALFYVKIQQRLSPNRTSARVEMFKKTCMDSCQFKYSTLPAFADLLQVWSVKLPNLGAQLVGVEIRLAT